MYKISKLKARLDPYLVHISTSATAYPLSKRTVWLKSYCSPLMKRNRNNKHQSNSNIN